MLEMNCTDVLILVQRVVKGGRRATLFKFPQFYFLAVKMCADKSQREGSCISGFFNTQYIYLIAFQIITKKGAKQKEEKTKICCQKYITA